LFVQDRIDTSETKKNMAEDESHIICVYYLKNTCANGDDCPRWHPADIVVPVPGFICKHYLEGHCAYGADCWKVHFDYVGHTENYPEDYPEDVPQTVFASSAPAVVFPKRQQKMEDWVDGDEEEEEKKESVAEEAAIIKPLLPPPACKFFLRGKCLNGDSCNFGHNAEDLQKPKEILTGDEWRAKHGSGHQQKKKKGWVNKKQ